MSKLLDHLGNPLKKQAFGLVGSIYEYPNNQRFRPRYYTNQDNELGANQLTRDLTVRWSRELYNQLPWVYAAVRTLSNFAVGSAYQPIYNGTNSEWGNRAITWLTDEFYPNCNKRGLDFVNSLSLMSNTIDIDGDLLLILGEENNAPKFQFVLCHRITSQGSKYNDPLPYSDPDSGPQQGPFPNTIISDGVVYDKQGQALGYNVVNSDNMVNSLLGNYTNRYFSARDARLVYDPRWLDRGRGFPALSSGILQGLSLQQIESYLIEKIKIQSLVAYTESTPNGEGPQEDQNTYESLLANNPNGTLGTFPGVNFNNAAKGLRIVNNPSIKYLNAAGGSISFPEASVSAEQTTDYITRLETHILQSLGVPHQILFSPDKISGRISDGVAKLFNSTVSCRQSLLDKQAGFLCGWAISKAIKNRELPPNDEDNLTRCFDFTHPTPFSLNDGNDRNSDLKDYQAGIKSLTSILAKQNISLENYMAEISDENIKFFNAAQKVSKDTGVELSIVINNMKSQMSMRDFPLNLKTEN